MTISVRLRVLTRAAQAWEAGRPHQAWQILDRAGMGDEWREFQRVALQHARRRFVRQMTVATSR